MLKLLIMIRTYIKPNKSKHNITLELPDDYLGEELEILILKKQEGLVQLNNESATNISDKYRGVFTAEDAKSFDKHTNAMRKEW